MSLVVARDAVQLTRGEVQTFVTKTQDGREKLGAFCATCGVRIYNATERLMSVKAGTLDDRSWLRPDGHYWVSRQQNWLEFVTAEVKS